VNIFKVCSLLLSIASTGTAGYHNKKYSKIILFVFDIINSGNAHA
jgi:hypothetical protein